jgi:hypothetical protein
MIKSDDNTDSTTPTAHQLPLIRQDLLRGQGGCGKMSPSLWPCRSLRTLRTSLEQIGPIVNVKMISAYKSLVFDEPGLQYKLWKRW